jgi:hypothetical protein
VPVELLGSALESIGFARTAPDELIREDELEVVPLLQLGLSTARAGTCHTASKERNGIFAQHAGTRQLGLVVAGFQFIQASRRAVWSRSGPGTPLSSTGPISAKDTGAASAASTTSWLTTTSPGRAYSAILAARFTVRPK